MDLENVSEIQILNLATVQPIVDLFLGLRVCSSIENNTNSDFSIKDFKKFRFLA